MKGLIAGVFALIGLLAGSSACATAGATRPRGDAEIGDPTAGEAADSSGSPRGGRAPGPPGSSPLMHGGCGLAPLDLRPKYVLPFTVGSRHGLLQGNCGLHSHDGRFNFGFDFRMPMRTPIIASRDGVVSAVRDVRPDGTDRVGDENYVIIDHGDGEYSRYIHITRGGALVSRGERVVRGDTIALSGDSGKSAFPHLHFDVVDGCTNGVCWTIPAAFLNSDPPIPTRLTFYTAHPF